MGILGKESYRWKTGTRSAELTLAGRRVQPRCWEARAPVDGGLSCRFAETHLLEEAGLVTYLYLRCVAGRVWGSAGASDLLKGFSLQPGKSRVHGAPHSGTYKVSKPRASAVPRRR